MDAPYFINLQKFQNLAESLDRIRIAAESAAGACKSTRQRYVDGEKAMPDCRHCEEIVDRLLREAQHLNLLISAVRRVALDADLKLKKNPVAPAGNDRIPASGGRTNSCDCVARSQISPTAARGTNPKPGRATAERTPRGEQAELKSPTAARGKEAE